MLRRIIQYRRRKVESELLPAKLEILGALRMVGVDIGSALGLQPHWRSYEGVVDFYLFEPHRLSFAALERSFAMHPYAGKFHIRSDALSGTGGERVLYILNSPTGSSLYPVNSGGEFVSQNDPYIFPVKQTHIQTKRLSEVLDEAGVDNVDIIKLDVQGAELEILEGIDERRRNSLLLVEAEVNISGGVSRNFSPYLGAATWAQLDELLVASGMRLLDISVARSYRPHDGDEDWYQREIFEVYTNSPTLSAHAWEADVVYVRDWHELVKHADVAGIRKLLLALCGYRFFSEAYFIVQEAEQQGVFDAAAAATIKSSIVRWHNARRRFWHRRGLLARSLRRVLRTTGVSQLLRWKQYMWFDYPNG